jgi:hypothetical protein
MGQNESRNRRKDNIKIGLDGVGGHEMDRNKLLAIGFNT